MLNNKRIIGWFSNLNITPDFMSESNTVTSYHAEICGISSSTLWSSKSDFPLIVRIGLDDTLNFYRFWLAHLISTCLNENNIRRPCNFPTITISPLFNESFSWQNLVFITKVFFNKAALETRLIFLLFLLFLNKCIDWFSCIGCWLSCWLSW